MKIDIDKTINDLHKTLLSTLSKCEVSPKLVILKASDDYASGVYVRNKLKLCSDLGIQAECVEVEPFNLLDTIEKYNKDDTVTGLMVQLPIPNIDTDKVLNAISPSKDVDCLTDTRQGEIYTKGINAQILPCTPLGIIRLIQHQNIEIKGKRVVVLGRSNIVGKPIARLLEQLNGTVTIIHSQTPQDDFNFYLSQADIVVSCVGKSKLFSSKDLSPNKKVTVIDVGINRDENNKLTGDFDTTNLLENVDYTPVPKGVGRLTVYSLIENLLKLRN